MAKANSKVYGTQIFHGGEQNHKRQKNQIKSSTAMENLYAKAFAEKMQLQNTEKKTPLKVS